MSTNKLLTLVASNFFDSSLTVHCHGITILIS